MHEITAVDEACSLEDLVILLLAINRVGWRGIGVCPILVDVQNFVSDVLGQM